MSLQNYFKAERQKKDQNHLSDLLEKQKQEQTHRSSINLQMAAKSLSRIESYSNTIYQESYVKSLDVGSLPLINSQNHSFRDRFKDKELYKTGVIVKSFICSKDRAQIAQQQFNSSHLEKDLYQIQNLNIELRDRNIQLENKPMIYGGARTENERIQKNVARTNSLVDHSACSDTSMLVFPDWKKIDKSKWMIKDTFKSAVNGQKAWSNIPVYSENDDNTYLGGYEITGQVLRKSIKNNKDKRPPFNPTLPSDLSQSILTVSQSIRTGLMDEALGINNLNLFSENERLNFYKQSLVKTKSIDHLLPYVHSNNYQGLSLKNLRPLKNDKHYVKSMAHHNQKFQSVKHTQKTLESQGTADKIHTQLPQKQIIGRLDLIKEDIQTAQTQSQFKSTQEGKKRTQQVFFPLDNKWEEEKIQKIYEYKSDEEVKQTIDHYFKK